MKGLILNNFYTLQDHMKLSMGIAIVMVIAFLIMGKPELMDAIVAGQILVFSMNIASSLQIDEKSKWDKMEITLPIRRCTVIKAKYIAFFLLVGIGVIVSLMTPMIAYIAGMEINLNDMVNGYSLGISICIGTLAIVYPAILIFGADKSETMLIIGAFVTVGLRFVVWILMNVIKGGLTINFNSSEVGVVALVVNILLFFVSYKISESIHARKNF